MTNSTILREVSVVETFGAVLPVDYQTSECPACVWSPGPAERFARAPVAGGIWGCELLRHRE